MGGCPQTCMIKLRIASCSALPQCSTHSHPAPLQARDAPLRCSVLMCGRSQMSARPDMQAYPSLRPLAHCLIILVAMGGCPQTCMIKLRIASCSALPQCSTHSHPAPLQARDAPLRSRPAPTRVFTGLLLRSYPRCCQVPQLRSRGSYRARRRSSCSASFPGWVRSSSAHSQTSRPRAGSAAGGTCLRC